MQTQALYDRASAPTETLTNRNYHGAITTLGHNRIIQDYHRTNYLTTGYERVMRVLPRPKPSLLRRLIRLFTNKKPRAVRSGLK
jgi:hypothetical protein